jgi:hypothetical protein
MEAKMDAKHKKKIVETVEKIRADMKKDAKLRKEVAKNHIRVLNERAKLDLSDIIAAHDISWKCPSLSLA